MLGREQQDWQQIQVPQFLKLHCNDVQPDKVGVLIYLCVEHSEVEVAVQVIVDK